MSDEQTVTADLKWKKFPVLDDGFVCLVDVMGDDYSVVQAARVSYGQDLRISEALEKEPGFVGKTEEQVRAEISKKDRELIRYLMRHRHTTPLEMAELKFLIRCPMDCWRQWIRHRTASVNEYSTRYTEAIDSAQATKPDEWRLQATNNKQGSSGTLKKWPDGFGPYHTRPGEYLTQMEEDFQRQARALYEERLKFGIAKEQARKDLPLSTYTEAYWKIDLHNLLHFLGLRMHSHAQKEIRDYATTIGEQIVKPLFPTVWEAFQDYHPHMGGMSLSRLEIEALARYTQSLLPGSLLSMHEELKRIFKNDRERAECEAKLSRFGFGSLQI